MTDYPSILKAAHVERGMRWMIFVSLCLHLCLIAAVLGKPPDRGKTIYFNPAYTVELIGTGGSSGAPGLPDTGEQSGESSGGSSDGGPTGRAEPLWKGPSGFTSQVKTLEKRTHTPLQAKTAAKTPLSTKKTAGSNTSGTAQGGAGSGQPSTRQPTPAGTGGRGGRGGRGGAGGTGYGLTPEQARFGRYYMAVFNKIQSAWVLPHYYEQEQLMATVEITIRADGRIVNTQFEKKSGDAEFDRSVMRAIQKANPLPPLPPGIKEPLLTIGIRFQ
jgi:TonB family protein